MEDLPPPPARPKEPEPEPELEPEPEPEQELTKKQKKAAAKEAAKLEAEAGSAKKQKKQKDAGKSKAKADATSTRASGPRMIWEGGVQTAEEDKKGKVKWLKTFAVVYDGGEDTEAGWRPRLEIYEKEKDRKDAAKALQTMDLSGAVVGPDVEEDKGRSVFSVLGVDGTVLLKLKAFKKSQGEVDDWTARIESVAQPSETFRAAAASSKEEAEAAAAEAAAAKEKEDIVVAQGALKQAEDKVEELKVELADVENLKQEAAEDPTLLAEIEADIERISRELSEAEAAVAHAKSELEREEAEAAAAEAIARKERAEAEEARETYSKVRTAAEEEHAVAQKQLLAQRQEEVTGGGRSLGLEELSRVPEERRAYLQWLFQHKYDEEQRGSIETSQVERLLYDLGIMPRNRAVASYVADLSVKGGRYRDGVSDVLLANIARQQEAIHDAELQIAKEGKAGFMARNLELKLKDDLGKLPADAPQAADLRAQMGQAANDVRAAEEREAVAKRALIVAEEELRKARAEEAEDRISFAEFDPWFSEHEAVLFDDDIRSLSVYSETIRSAICHFQEYDPDLVGELPPQEFRLMCESMGWEPEDIEDSVEMIRRTEDGRISLPHFVSWYTDDGLVRNVFAAFDRDDDQKLHFHDFAELCERQSTVQLRPDDVQELFNSYDCTQSAAASSDDSLPVGEWLEGVGFAEYAETFVRQGFDTLASIRGAGLNDADLRDIGVGKLRHRKAILSLISQEGYLQPQDLKRLFLKAQQSKVNREQLQLEMQGQLERWLPSEEQYRDGTRWKQCYVTVWLAGAAAKLTVYENEETFKQLCDNVIIQWVDEPPPGSKPGLRPGLSMDLIHASASPVVTRQTPAGPQDMIVPHGAISAEHREFVVEDRKNGTKMKFRMSSSQSLLNWVRKINDVAVRGTAGYEEVEARLIGGRRVQRERREKHNHTHHHHHGHRDASTNRSSRSKSRGGMEQESRRRQGDVSRRSTTSRSGSKVVSHDIGFSKPPEGYPPPSAASSPVSDARRRSQHGSIRGNPRETPRGGVRGMSAPAMASSPRAFDAAKAAIAEGDLDRRRSRHGGTGTPREASARHQYGVSAEHVSYH